MSKEFSISAPPPPDRSGPVWWFIYFKGKLLVSGENDVASVPLISHPGELGIPFQEGVFAGSLEGKPCFAVALTELRPVPKGMIFEDLRQLYERLDQAEMAIAFRALHLLHWSKNSRYCGRCGMKTKDKEDLPAKECPGCGTLCFPRISPAVIVLVEKGDCCLLACSPRFKDGFYSVLAGFSEAGESLEETVVREVREETGIEVRDIRYFGSQPWPFPDSLMVGFTAQYAGGEIRIDRTEILDAQWFAFDRLPKIPGKISIARRLIDWFVAKHERII